MAEQAKELVALTQQVTLKTAGQSRNGLAKAFGRAA